LRREDVENQKARRWRLYVLETEPTPRQLLDQSTTNWILRNLALPFGAKYFIAWSGGPFGVAKEIHVYETASGRDLWHETTERMHEMYVYLDPIGETFGYTYSQNHGHVRIRRFSDFKEVKTTASDCSGIAPFGREFSTCQWRLPDKSDLKAALPFDNGSCLQSVYSPNGELLVGGSENGTVYLVDTKPFRATLSPFMPK